LSGKLSFEWEFARQHVQQFLRQNRSGEAADFLLCEQQLPGKRPYGVVNPTSNAACVKPLTDADRQKEDEDDEAFVKKLEKEGLDMLKRLQKAN
jgi:hypothetical protein